MCWFGENTDEDERERDREKERERERETKKDILETQVSTCFEGFC